MRRRRKRGMPPVAAGLLTAVLAAAAFFFAFTQLNPFASPYQVSAVFPSANNIKPKSPVRIAGVNVGKVKRIERVNGSAQAARVVMEFKKEGLPIHKDAVFTIRPRIFLEGNFFVDVQPGSPSAPTLADGDTVPINQTKTPVQLDQILTALQKDTREDLRATLFWLSKGLEGEGAKGYNRSIPYWEPAYRDGAIVSDATRGTVDGDLSNYIKNAGTTAEALDRNAGQLKSLITDFNTTARAFASEDGNLEATIAELPRTLRAGMPALDALNRAFPPLRAFVKDFRPGVRSTGPAIDASLPFVRQLRDLVQPAELRGLARDLRATVPSLARLTEGQVPFNRQARELSSCQNEVVLPWTHDTIQDKQFPATGRVFEEAPKPLPGLAGESRAGDANGQWFRVSLSGPSVATPNGAGGFNVTSGPLLGANPPKGKRPPMRSDVPCETQTKPDLRTEATPAPRNQIRAKIPADRLDDYQKLVDKAADALRQELKANGLEGRYQVTNKPATAKTVLEGLR